MKIGFFVDSVPFDRKVISGEASLGGSESACLGLARALQARGHQVHIIATKLDESCHGLDHAGVVWHPAEVVYELSQVADWDVFVSLRMPHVFRHPIKAKLRLLWNQDLLIGDQAKNGVMSTAWAYDHVVYVSEYHRKQWEGILPELKPLGWVTKNGFDPAHVPTDTIDYAAEAFRRPNRIIHISRPERGLRPLLEMWPALKEKCPDAELAICRYNSMYDAGGWGKICASYDQLVQMVNQQVGGITYLGELGKADLYRAISEAAVMWYPGVVDFAETSCVAAIEAQACGTPFVGSFKGALPETVPAGVLLTGDASSAEYQLASVSAVAEMLDGCKRKARHYRELQQDGLKHVESYTYAVIAQEWEHQIDTWFEERAWEQSIGMLRQLLHYDDHTAAEKLAADLIYDADESEPDEGEPFKEVWDAHRFCKRVIKGEEQTAEQYAQHALPDPLVEWDHQTRFHEAAALLAGKSRVLDVACGNGAFALGLALQNPDMQVVGIDYAQGNIDRAKKAAEEAGLSDRCTFYQSVVWDFNHARMAQGWNVVPVNEQEHTCEILGGFDGVFCGEFLEHVSDAAALIDGIEQAAGPDAVIVYTMPNGPFSEMLERGTPVHKGHVHHFTQDDITTVFGEKKGLSAQYMHLSVTPRGQVAGHWIVRYETGGGKAKSRDYATRIKTTRPKAKLSVGLIMKNAEHDLARCLESVWPIADEIVIGDTGSTDHSIEIAQQFGATVIHIDPVEVDPDGFAGARNKVLDACTGDWFLMIDSDEVLVGSQQLWKYLEGGAYNGYSIPQVHLMLDSVPHADKPVRLFKIQPDIRYYGCIHEQPQMGDCNGDITPALEIGDVQFAHTGYLSESQRRRKMFQRNLPLLMKDKERFPDRVLGRLLIMRDLVNLGDYERELADGALTTEARRYYGQAIGLFEQDFNDPSHRYYGLARPFYEIAIKGLSSAMEFEIAIAGRQHGMGTAKARPSRIWVRRIEDVEKVIAHQVAGIKAQLTPKPIDVEPIVAKKEVAA